MQKTGSYSFKIKVRIIFNIELNITLFLVAFYQIKALGGNISIQRKVAGSRTDPVAFITSMYVMITKE